jgi:hypothetical protein
MDDEGARAQTHACVFLPLAHATLRWWTETLLRDYDFSINRGAMRWPRHRSWTSRCCCRRPPRRQAFESLEAVGGLPLDPEELDTHPTVFSFGAPLGEFRLTSLGPKGQEPAALPTPAERLAAAGRRLAGRLADRLRRTSIWRRFRSSSVYRVLLGGRRGAPPPRPPTAGDATPPPPTTTTAVALECMAADKTVAAAEQVAGPKLD